MNFRHEVSSLLLPVVFEELEVLFQFLLYADCSVPWVSSHQLFFYRGRVLSIARPLDNENNCSARVGNLDDKCSSVVCK